jgi:glycosyltransferase involved in cell wall biosynthesis
MKKTLLFIISNMESGGVSKSMSSLLNTIDTNRYSVDCFILAPQGIFIDSIPKAINIIADERTGLLFSKFPQNILPLLKKAYFLDAFIRIFAAIFMLFNKGIGGWLLSRRIYKIKKEYDLVVDYNGQHQLYYMIDRIKATKKATFFHSDYQKWPYYYKMDKIYMPKADHIFTISKKCVKSLIDFFPKEKNKIQLFENISSTESIFKMAGEQITDQLDVNSFNLITIGHVCEAKGAPLALKAAKILKDKGVSFKWYFIGNIDNELFYNNLVLQNNLEQQIIFMGLRSNPYPYIKQADIFVHPSQFEGKSIALDEAKILCKPIVVTNFSTVGDQFTDRLDASICEMNEIQLANKIEELLINPSLRNDYATYLKQHHRDNSDEIEKIYRLLN